MAKMIQVPYGDITIPTATAQDVQKEIYGVHNDESLSLSALGLLINLHSFPPTWELHKTELYKRYAKDGERSVRSAWSDLEQARYIIEFKYRVGKKYEYVYYFRKFPFSDEEKVQIINDAKKEYGEIWGLQNADPKKESENESWGLQNEDSNLKSSKRRDNKDPLYNSIPLNKEEEEEASPSELVSFLLSKNITLENATKFEMRLLKEGLTGYTNEDVLKAIEKSLADFQKGICDEPYIWAVGKLKRILDNKGKGINIAPPKPKRKSTRTEVLPDWFDNPGAEEPKKTENKDLPSIEDMLKQLRS